MSPQNTLTPRTITVLLRQLLLAGEAGRVEAVLRGLSPLLRQSMEGALELWAISNPND